MRLRIVQFLTLVLIALCLIPMGAHVFALPNKIVLPRDAYFLVQGIYRGWALFGAVLIPAFLCAGWLAVLLRYEVWQLRLTAASAVCLALTLVIFFAFVFPANQATVNWTVIPDNWEALRTRWEYGHAASAVLTFLAFCGVAVGVVWKK